MVINTLETTDMSATKQLFKGEIVCFKCGQVQTYEGLLDGGECTNCQVSLVKELF